MVVPSSGVTPNLFAHSQSSAPAEQLTLASSSGVAAVLIQMPLLRLYLPNPFETCSPPPSSEHQNFYQHHLIEIMYEMEICFK